MVSSMGKCIVCETQLTGKQVKYCRKKCEYKQHDSKRYISSYGALKCRECGGDFFGSKDKAFCRKECRISWYNNNHKRGRRCFVCGSSDMLGYKYCSKKCKVAYWSKHGTRNENHRREYARNRLKNDPIVRLRYRLSDRIRKQLKKSGYVKHEKTTELLGCTIVELREYLSGKFTAGMSWDNYGKWHIDHIIPLAAAKTEEEIIMLWHYTNLQPLWAIDNLLKHDKYKIEDFETYKERLEHLKKQDNRTKLDF